MKRRRLALLVATATAMTLLGAAPAIAPPTPEQQDLVCKPLREVLAAAAKNFAPIRGEAEDRFFFKTTVQMGYRDQDCAIRIADGVYSCTVDFEKMSPALRRCLPQAPIEITDLQAFTLVSYRFGDFLVTLTDDGVFQVSMSKAAPPAANNAAAPAGGARTGVQNAPATDLTTRSGAVPSGNGPK
jgi:hypothetical protein